MGGASGYIGEISFFLDPTLRPGYLWADGSEFKISEYPELAVYAQANNWEIGTDSTYKTPVVRGNISGWDSNGTVYAQIRALNQNKSSSSGLFVPTNFELELLYSYDGTEGKTLTNFNCGDANLILVNFDFNSTEGNTGLSTILTRSNLTQYFTAGFSINCSTWFLFSEDGTFSQDRQLEYPGAVDNNTKLVIRRIFSLKQATQATVNIATTVTTLECPYSVGDIMHTKNATPPSQRWPGTEWAAIETFLLGASENHQVGGNGGTGGSETHALTEAEGPAHVHNFARQGIGLTTAAAYSPASLGPNFGAVFSSVADQAIVAANMNSSGESKPFSIMPPYTAVYIWERIA